MVDGNIVLVLVIVVICSNCLVFAQEGDEHLWTGGVEPKWLKWDENPGPCIPPEDHDCRGLPYKNCYQWWIPCGTKGRDPNKLCCWSAGFKATSSCRQPRDEYGETLGKRKWYYCLPNYEGYTGNLARSGGRNKTKNCKKKPIRPSRSVRKPPPSS